MTTPTPAIGYDGPGLVELILWADFVIAAVLPVVVFLRLRWRKRHQPPNDGGVQ